MSGVVGQNRRLPIVRNGNVLKSKDSHSNAGFDDENMRGEKLERWVTMSSKRRFYEAEGDCINTFAKD